MRRTAALCARLRGSLLAVKGVAPVRKRDAAVNLLLLAPGVTEEEVRQMLRGGSAGKGEGD